MTEKRFTDDGTEDIENQSFTDNLTGKTYWIDNGLDEIVDLLNELDEKYVDEFSLRETLQQELQRVENENEQLKKLLECSRQEANDYNEELMGKDEFIRLYKRIGDELKEENEELKSENKRLTDKLNQTALELVGGVISQGKATEISEMSYREFLDYRAKNGKPMELQL